MNDLKILVLLCAVLVAAACSYDPYGDLTCDDGEVDGARVCVGGIWVAGDGGVISDATTGDTGPGPADMGPDAQLPDAGQDAGADAGDSGVDACVPETNLELCSNAGANCGSITVTDSCGDERTPDCGTCTDPETCGGSGTDNVCGCADSDDQTLCANEGAECGAVNVFDPACGITRQVQCGNCASPETCGGAGVANECGCTESNQDFCARLGANCGTVNANDLCGVARSVNCGTCAGPLDSCGGGGTPNVCGCDAATVCDQRGAECGMVDFSASCPNVSNVDCGGCGANGSCSANMCSCSGGYEFDMGSGSCVDIDECSAGTDNCDPDATCSNSPGSFSCTCNPGYTGSGQACSDVDECSAGTDNCDMNATCTNTDGSFTCMCNTGFTGDGVTCSAVPSAPTIDEVVTTAATGSSTLTTGTMTAQRGSLYVAFVALNTGTRSVSSVQAFGQNFTQRFSQCDGVDDGTLDVWTLRSTGGTSGPVTVNLSNNPFAASVIVYKIDGAATMSDPVVRTAVANTATGNACSGGMATSSFNGTTTPDGANNLMLLGWSRPGTSVSMNALWTLEDSASSSGASSGRNTDLSVFSEVTTVGGVAVQTVATFGSSIHWVGGLVEISGP